MTMTLPPTLATYIAASNPFNAETLLSCFAANAVVADEGRTHRGTEEIRQWIAGTEAYHVTLDVLRAEEQERETVVTCRVAGTFPGSPIELRFFFTLAGEKIAALTIQP